MKQSLHGVGLGLRSDMAEEFLDRKPPEVDFVEIHPENYMRRGGRFPHLLELARRDFPVGTHGLTMCYGSLEPFDSEYLADLHAFLRDLDVSFHSDHLCFGGAHGVFVHDLLPLPFTDEAAKLCVQRIHEARDALDRPLAIENVSYYAPQSRDGLDEAHFLVEVLRESDALLLLDVNNVYVNSKNFGFDPRAYIDLVPAERVAQIHVAGHMVRPDELRIDTHGEPICDDVYGLLDYTLGNVGPRPVLLERDNNIPSLDDMLAEVRRLQAIHQKHASGTV
jgi:uncharacterized protein